MQECGITCNIALKNRYFVPMNAITILNKYFGFENFRLDQQEIIDEVISGRDCLVLMPTGGGKSVCYQIPALIFKGTTIIISPLIALMKDQVDALRQNGINAAFLNSSMDINSQNQLLVDLKNGVIKLLYIAPERLAVNGFIDLLKTINVTLFAIDEAHCISHWGHDFRPDYLLLSRLKNNFPNVPVIALTATADNVTRKDIVQKLNLSAPKVFISSFNRSNIRYLIEGKEDHFNRILDFLSAHKDESGIIYCLSRSNTEELTSKLKDKGINALSYHAGLDSKTRSLRQEQFKKDEVQIMVATIAFGMGIDKPNVRFVIHTCIPKNIESYYQETGRAGRDGLPSQALLFYSVADLIKLKSFVSVEGNVEQTKIGISKLNKMADFCSSYLCRRKYLLNYFDELYNAPCGNCDICLGKKVENRFDGTIIAQMALSAVMRLQQKYGVGYVINFLKGSESQKIYEHHRLLPTFGKGREHSADEWRLYFRQMMDNGYLQQHGEYSILKITEKGKDVLYNNGIVMFVEAEKKKVAKTERRKKYAPSGERGNYIQELFDELKKLRLTIAQQENVPPYIIFNDNTLIELSTYLPLKIEDLTHISGFGSVKIAKYGKEFLSNVNEFCSKNNNTTRMGEKVSLNSSVKSIDKSISTSDTKMKSFELFSEGVPIHEIAKQRRLTEGTVTDHLLHFIMTGKLNVLKFVSREKLDVITKSIGEHGDQNLSTLKESLGSIYSYSEIKAVINYLKRNADYFIKG